MNSKVLEVQDYKVYYKTLSGYIRAVDGVYLSIREGEIVGLIGESGCGKSTFAQSLILLKNPMVYMGGNAIFENSYDLTKLTLQERRKILLKKIAFIPQYALDALPVIKKIKSFVRDLARDKGFSAEEVLEVFKERLKQVGLSERILEMYPLELSGGMRQRVVIAISTLFKPKLLIADEPTSALDVVTQRQVLELLKNLRDRGIAGSILFITHDIASIRQVADSVATMYAGKIVETGPLEDIVKDPLHPYTSLLIRSVPSINMSYKVKKLTGLGGSPPSLLYPPRGCRFHPRCPYATSTCSEQEPCLIDLDDRWVACRLYSKR